MEEFISLKRVLQSLSECRSKKSEPTIFQWEKCRELGINAEKEYGIKKKNRFMEELTKNNSMI